MDLKFFGRIKDLSVEAHALKPEYEELFTQQERDICRERWNEFGYEAKNL